MSVKRHRLIDFAAAARGWMETKFRDPAGKVLDQPNRQFRRHGAAVAHAVEIIVATHVCHAKHVLHQRDPRREKRPGS